MRPKSSRKRALSSLLCTVFAVFAFLSTTREARGQPAGEWLRVQTPSTSRAWERFENPPAEYGLALWWFWNGDMSDAEIVRDLRDMRDRGARSLVVFPYYGTTVEYLSSAYFDRVRFAVAEAKKAGLRMWFMDEGSYPSGFAGGRITRERPDLRMRVLAAGERFTAGMGQKVALKRDGNTVAVFATNSKSGERRFLNETEEWTAPDGLWDIRTIRWEFRTSPTRHANRAGFFKDSMFSLSDALDPEATKFFLDAVHEEYRKHIGDEFGKTVMGFMGDEPSVAGPPWTPRFVEEFRKRKGYDLRPHLAFILDETAPGDAGARADYFDVWTDLYNENFFRPQAEWCERYGMEYIVHLCGEEDTPVFVRLNGDYFKTNRHVHMPGVDAIWRQIWYDKTEYYPKLASSSAHLRGRPRSFTESFAVYGAGLSLKQAKWVFDYQVVRGINHFQAMEYLSSAAEHRLYFHPPHWGASPLWPYFREFADYASRLSYLLSMGRPAAKLAVYFPTTSGWANDWEPDKAVRQIARRLMEGQRDFDLVDEDGLKSDLTVVKSALRNRSGEDYTGLIIPPVRFLSSQALEKISQFARSGGKVLFLGGAPETIVEKTYKDGMASSGHAFFRDPPSSVRIANQLDDGALTHLPASDVSLAPATTDVKYLRRSLEDGEVYFFFNEGGRKIETTATLDGSGVAELWDARTGERTTLPSKRAGEKVSAPLWLEPYATAVIAVRSGAGSAPVQHPERLRNVLAIGGDWSIQLDEKSVSGPLRSWADLGMPGYWGTGIYRKKFDYSGNASGRRLWLDLGEVRYAARVRLNGQDLGSRAWGPFRFDASRAIRAGQNALEVEVASTRANELAGDASRLKSIEDKGWLKNSYVKMYLKFDQEMVPAGLLGPVVLAISEPAQ